MTSFSTANISNLGVVILQSKLKNSVIAKLLSQKQIKFRTSERLLEGTVLFPKAKLAFMVLDITRTITPYASFNLTTESSAQSQGYESHSGTTENIARIDKFISAHGQCVVILQAPLFTSSEFRIMSQLQFKYLQHSVEFLPAHSGETCVDAMLTLASVQTPPTCDILHERMSDLMNSLLQPPAFLSMSKTDS